MTKKHTAELLIEDLKKFELTMGPTFQQIDEAHRAQMVGGGGNSIFKHWIVDEDGNDVGLRFERTDPTGMEIWHGENGRSFSLKENGAVAWGLDWDPVEEAYEVTGEFDTHPAPFSLLDRHQDDCDLSV